MSDADLETADLDQVSRRLDRLPASSFHAKVLVVSGLSLFFDTLDSVITAFILAHLRQVWHFDILTIGVVSAIGRAGYLVGAAGCGFVADRIGRKKSILFTLVLYSVFSAARGASNDIWTFAVLNFIAYVFIGAESSIVPPYLAELWPSRIRGKLNGWMMGFFGLGIALAPVWMLVILPNLGWRWALFLTAPFALLAGSMRRTLPESPRWLAKTGRTREAATTMAWIEAKVGTGHHEPVSPMAPPAPVATPPRARARDLIGPRYIRVSAMLWIAWFAEFGVLHTFQTFVPTILAAEHHTIVKSYEYSVVIYAAVIPAYVLGGQVVEWLDRKLGVVLAFSGTAVSGTLFCFASAPWQIMVFGALTSCFLALGSTALYTYTPELYPTEIRATGMGIASSWGRLGTISLLLVFGSQYTGDGKSLLFALSDVMLVVAAVVVLIFGPATRGKSLEVAAQAAAA